MENKERYINIHNNTFSIEEKKRSGILYYSISQVAALLGETDSTIRYYTNLFDDLLKIQVSNKELIYTDKDIDKLEFLIRLKNKGLTIKEIQSYCDDIPLDENIVTKQISSFSINDLIELITEVQRKEIMNLKSELFSHMDTLKHECISELKDYLINELSIQNQYSKSITDDIFLKTMDSIEEKFKYESSKTLENLVTLSKEIEKKSAEQNDQLLNRIRKFENIVEKAYTIEHEIESERKPSLIEKIFGFR